MLPDNWTKEKIHNQVSNLDASCSLPFSLFYFPSMAHPSVLAVLSRWGLKSIPKSQLSTIMRTIFHHRTDERTSPMFILKNKFCITTYYVNDYSQILVHPSLPLGPYKQCIMHLTIL